VARPRVSSINETEYMGIELWLMVKGVILSWIVGDAYLLEPLDGWLDIEA